MEPGVTVWGRAGSLWALPRSCIYRCRISREPKMGALDSIGLSERELVASRFIATSLRGETDAINGDATGMARSQAGGSRRDAGFVGASLSADVPLTTRIEHAFVFVKGDALRIFDIGPDETADRENAIVYRRPRLSQQTRSASRGFSSGFQP